jgi:D-amino peptidase
MKILIAVDMEGITGVVNWDHVSPGHAEYERMRALMTDDVNAAIAGAASAGADEIVVTDGHWNSSNILIEKLDSRARLNSGTPAPFSMVQGIDDGVNAALFIGYHAQIGTHNAILDHTWSSVRVAGLWLNDRPTGEFGLNAALCGHFNVPVLMVSGDQSVCEEAKDFISGLETAVVKRATGRHAAECLPPGVSQPLIRSTAQRAVQRFYYGDHPEPYRVSTPVQVKVTLMYSDMADRAVLLPELTRLDGRTVSFASPDMAAAYQMFRAAVTLANRT